MKSSIAAALILLLGAVSALPASDLEKRDDPSLSPVNLIHMPTEGFTCGDNKYTAHDVYLAAQYGVRLQATGQARGKKSTQYPNGRFPHAFTSNKNGVAVGFPDYCPENDDLRKEYPLVKNGPYNGGISNNNKWGNDRVVYMYEDGEVAYDGNDIATFCGVMTHSGAEEGSFVMCESS